MATRFQAPENNLSIPLLVRIFRSFTKALHTFAHAQAQDEPAVRKQAHFYLCIRGKATIIVSGGKPDFSILIFKQNKQRQPQHSEVDGIGYAE